MSASRNVLLLTGPNLSQLGVRQPEVYGTQTLADVVASVRAVADGHGITIHHVDSQSEATLVEAVHAARGTADAIVINPGALTHYGWSLGDAIASYPGYVVEVHLSNVLARESWRHTSTIGPHVNGTVIGFGAQGFVMALDAVARHLDLAVE
jgi:3-dehydroquinate dehydratase-2